MRIKVFRFLAYDMLAWVPGCRELSLGGGVKAVVVELNAGAEDAVAEERDFPAAGVGDFGDEATDVEAFETSSRRGTCTTTFSRVAVSQLEDAAEVRVAKALEFVFPA